MHVHVTPASILSSAQREAWRRLQASSPDLAGPFFCPEFTDLIAGVREDVFVAELAAAGETVGFFPYQIRDGRDGEPVGAFLSDYHGLIVSPGARVEIPRVLRACGLSRWRYDHLPGSQLGFERFRDSVGTSPYLDLQRGYAQYADQLKLRGADIVAKTERQARRLQRDHGSLVFQVDAADPVRMLEILMTWKSAQYVRTGKRDRLRLPWVRQAMERLCDHRASSFAGVLSVLFAGDDLVAAHLGLRSQTIWHYWLPAYDTAYSSYSPGLILLLRMAEVAPAIGIQRIDLGKGDAPYKRRLMSGEVPLAQGRAEASPLWRLRRGVRRVARRGLGFARSR